ncbi:MAG: cell division protein FtsL [Gammaproteobacteria bacterium]|nr:cell division protein FtsL [Gammaproteobacteria bacterium]
MSGRPGVLIVLLALVVVSSLGVVYSKHQSRKLFVELQALDEARDSMDIEWGQLQLEQSTLTMQGKIERAARERLGMVSLTTDRMVIVRP